MAVIDFDYDNYSLNVLHYQCVSLLPKVKVVDCDYGAWNIAKLIGPHGVWICDLLSLTSCTKYSQISDIFFLIWYSCTSLDVSKWNSAKSKSIDF